MTIPEQKTSGVLNDFIFQDDVSSAGDGNELDLLGVTKDYTWYVKVGSGVTSGSVIIEQADQKGYSGGWSQIASINLATKANTQVVVQNSGPMRAVRTRIASINNGSITITGLGA